MFSIINMYVRLYIKPLMVFLFSEKSCIVNQAGECGENEMCQPSVDKHNHVTGKAICTCITGYHRQTAIGGYPTDCVTFTATTETIYIGKFSIQTTI